MPSDSVEIAESIDDVRGICRISGRLIAPKGTGDAVDRGDGGEELPSVVCRGRGEEVFRNWLNDCVLGGDTTVLPRNPPSCVPVAPVVLVAPDAKKSTKRSLGDLGWSLPALRLDRGDLEEYGESLAVRVVLTTVGECKLLPVLPVSLRNVSLTCSGDGACLRGVV